MSDQPASSPTPTAIENCAPCTPMDSSPAGATSSCPNCTQLHSDVVKSVASINSKLDQIMMRVETLFAERQQTPSPHHNEAAPSPMPLQNNLAAILNGVQQSNRKRKPPKEPKHDQVNKLEALHNMLIKVEANNQSPVVEQKLESMKAETPSTPTPTSVPATPPASKLYSDTTTILAPRQYYFGLLCQQGAALGVEALFPIGPQSNTEATLNLANMMYAANMARNEGMPDLAQQQQFLNLLMQQSINQSQQQEENQQQPERQEETHDASVSRCSNCSTTKTTAWRRDYEGKLVCNACGLYFRLHKTHRPVHMRKDFIQQRFRRRDRNDGSTSPSAMLNQLLSLSQAQVPVSMPPFNFFDQLTQSLASNGHQLDLSGSANV
ncbi:unnamed protein product, partial [Mesorhabditis spiculigera]